MKNLSKNSEYDLLCLVRRGSNFSKLTGLNVKIQQCDLLDKNQLRTFSDGTDVVIHLATLLESHKDKEEIFNSNVAMTQNILDCFSDIKQLIFSSTNVTIDPHSAYAKSKVKCEDLIKVGGIDYTILRITPVLGKGSNSKSAALIRAINDGRYIPIPGDGKQILQPVHVNDVISAIITTIMNKEYFRLCAIASQPIELEDFVDLTGQVLGRKIRKFHLPLKLLRFVLKFYEAIGKNPEIASGQIDDLKNLTKDNALKSDFYVTPLSDSIKDSIL